MKSYMDEDFLLETETAGHLFHDYAENLPIIDYHCHILPEEIYEDRRFDNIVQIWLGGRDGEGAYSGDHYKLRLMRSNGVGEEYVTGDKPGLERLEKLGETLEMAIGNPVSHWCNLELRRYFGYNGFLSRSTAKEVWELCNDRLRSDPAFSARGLIRQSRVKFIGTTDDPTSTLEWHKKIAGDPSIGFEVCPSFRPDKAMGITKPGFARYMEELAESAGTGRLDCAGDVFRALEARLDEFKKAGCRAADCGLDYVMYRPGTEDEADAAYKKALSGEKLTVEEAEKYQTAMLLFLGRAYHRLGIVMQLHYSCLRNVNRRAFETLGADTGFDAIAQNSCGNNIAALLSALNETDECPRTILYSLNPTDNAQIDSIIGGFQSDEIPGKIQHGAAWWFNDTKKGMEEQMTSLANLGVLGGFVGMLTDSRSFLSYARHDYFRRIFCNLIGGWVENGEYPNDEALLRRIVDGVCCGNAARYFNINIG